jgi:hypothetical protein
MRRTTTTAAVLLAALLAAGCSSGEGDGKPESTSTAAAPSTAASESASSAATPVKLSVEWVPKLDAAGDDAPEGVCEEIGTEDCVKHVTELTELVYDVEDAIRTADAMARYPSSMETIGDVQEASKGYVEAGCRGSTDNPLGNSECAGYAAQLLIGPATLSMTMYTDEVSAP